MQFFVVLVRVGSVCGFSIGLVRFWTPLVKYMLEKVKYLSSWWLKNML